MKTKLRSISLFLLSMFLAAPLLAQAATRTVVLTWQASTSTSVTGYSLYRCTVINPATSCTPNVSGTAIGTTGSSTLTYTDTAVPTGSAYSYAVIANAPACTSTSSLSVPCGNSTPSNTTVPVPPSTDGAKNIVVVVP